MIYKNGHCIKYIILFIYLNDLEFLSVFVHMLFLFVCSDLSPTDREKHNFCDWNWTRGRWIVGSFPPNSRFFSQRWRLKWHVLKIPRFLLLSTCVNFFYNNFGFQKVAGTRTGRMALCWIEPCIWPRYGLDETNQFWSFWSPKCLACLLYLRRRSTTPSGNPIGGEPVNLLMWQTANFRSLMAMGFVESVRLVFNKFINGPDNSFHWVECYNSPRWCCISPGPFHQTLGAFPMKMFQNLQLFTKTGNHGNHLDHDCATRNSCQDHAAVTLEVSFVFLFLILKCN